MSSRGKPAIMGAATILILVTGLIMTLYLLFAMGYNITLTFEKAKGSLTIVEAGWESNGVSVKSVSDGDLVYAVVKLSSKNGYEGYVEIRVRRDIKLLPDTTVAAVKQYYIIKPGGRVEVKIAFRASCFMLSRGYHLDVLWPGGRYVMEPRYPPRLRVRCRD